MAEYFDRTLKHGFDAWQRAAESDDARWFRDLLARWTPAGGGCGGTPLRLAIRNGYVNFYRLGQSVAKVSLDGGPTLRAEIHEKYAGGRGDGYAKVVKGMLVVPGGATAPYEPDSLDTWVQAAMEYSGDEKRFVDRVVGASESVIDLEMGLPAMRKGDSAPRMDIVALETRRGAPTVTFWEAKLMGDGRLRSGTIAMPEVHRQLVRYNNWISEHEQEARVAAAYREVCRDLVRLHGLAAMLGTPRPALGDLVREVATMPNKRLPAIVPAPRLLIEDDAKPNASWQANGHHARLRDAGHHIQIMAHQGDATLEVPA
jgi:hypothetical protein